MRRFVMMKHLKTFFWLALTVVAVAIASCDRTPGLETRTFELQYMNPGEALEMVRPYVYVDREGAPGVVTHFEAGITVRETEENLDRIGAVLEQYDLPKPGVRLNFQIVEADGFTGRDARIADVQTALEELFRFEGYRLVTEAHMAAIEGTGASQMVGDDERRFQLEAQIRQVRGRGDKATVTIEVMLVSVYGDVRINTSLSVPVGETVVLGSSNPSGSPAIILTVRPELVPLPSGS
jgi:hypothetical protein